MVFLQFLAGFHATIDIVDLPGNLLFAKTIFYGNQVSYNAVYSSCQAQYPWLSILILITQKLFFLIMSMYKPIATLHGS